MNLFVIFVGPPSPLEHLAYWCIIAAAFFALACAMASARTNKALWRQSDRWNRTHYKGAGNSEYDAAREGDIGHPIGGQ